MPESEPEVAQLCNWLHYHGEVAFGVSLGEGELGVYGTRREEGRALAGEVGCVLREREEPGFPCWCEEALGISAFEICYGVGREVREMRHLFNHYARLRRALFLSPSFI